MILLEDVSFGYGGDNNKDKNLSIKNINLKIPKGQVLLLCGESGCGKTTITRLINGLIPNYYEGNLDGRIEVAGLNIKETTLENLSVKVGSVFQNPRTQFFNVNTTDELVFGCENSGMNPDEIYKRVNNIIKPLNLETLLERSIFELSGGEKQRVACGSVAALLPDIIVMDEPSSNLDISSIKKLGEIISTWKSCGKTIIIAEHRLHYLINISDRVIYMKDGQIERDFGIEEFKKLKRDEIVSLSLREFNIRNFEYNETFDNENHICLKNFYMKYGKRCVLDIGQINFPKGSVMAILGDNGAGKSTFVQHLCGLVKKPSGLMERDGRCHKGKKRCRDFFMVMQDVNHQLFTESVEEELRLSSNDFEDISIKKLLKKLNLHMHYKSHPMSLSGGQKQRVAIACAVASGRDYLIFDEPTSGLDYRHMLEVAELIKKLAEKGKTILIVTHDPELVSYTCNHICFLKSGKLEFIKKVEECKIWLGDYFSLCI